MVPLGYKFCVLLLVTIISSAQATNSSCLVVDGDSTYDLSELATKDYWEYTETLHTRNKQVYYLSVCHPLRNAPDYCTGDNTGVCVFSDLEGGGTQIIANAGQVSASGHSVAQSGWLEYVYENGQKCDERGRNETYVTRIYLMCASSEAEETLGPVRMSSTACQLTFAWMTRAGCPQTERAAPVKPTTCLTTFPNSNHTLNLHSLHSASYYNTQSGSTTYEVNICGAVVSGKCTQANTTVCKESAGNEPSTIANTDSMELTWRDQVLVLQYKSPSMTVEVGIHCDRSVAQTELYFVSASDAITTFSMRTSAVCAPQETSSCVLEDEGNVYDLRPLHKETGNWEAYDTASADKTLLYHINVCGPVNPERYYHCPSGPIGACQSRLGKDASYSLGFITSDPVVNREDRSITILYTGGDACMEGKHSRSTRINLICHKYEQEPVFVERTETCEYVFQWLTPVACPRHKTTGTNCQVKDPLYGNEYDLNPLRDTQKDYKVAFGELQYFLNLCGPLITPCGSNSGAGICQVNEGQKFSGGQVSSEVTFHDGSLSMEFVNGSGNCQGDLTRTTRMIFVCNHEVSGRDGPEMFPGDGCSLNYIWKTSHACPPYTVIDCSFYTPDGHLYDLNELSSSDLNREYYSSDGKKKYVFNVCRSVVHSKNSRCPYKAGACIIDRDHGNNSVNIGEVHSGLYLDADKLKLKYTNGDICKDQISYETVIEFICQEGTESYPQLVAEENCTYYFEWKSSVACPKMVTYTTDNEGGENCQVKNPHTDYTFDLNSLKSENGYEVRDDRDLHLTLNVCAPVSNNKCSGEGTGACSYTHNDTSNTINAGQANDKLHVLPGFLYLHYIGGDQCNSTTQRSTFISFICGAENATQGPVLVHDDLEQCTYFVNWYTEAACERRINCYVDTWSSRLDLSPLIMSTRNYEVTNPNNSKEKFYLNVCRPLNPIIGLNCKPGSAACLSNSISKTGPLNLGHPQVSLVNDYETGIKMMYTHGSTCLFQNGYDITTLVNFICDKNVGKGIPVFKNVTHDCQYQFDWYTSLVCEHDQEVPEGPVCQIRFDEAKTNVNLIPLQRPEGYVVRFNNKSYKINVCGPACTNKAGVCTDDGDNYGLSSMSELQWDYNSLKLTYYGGASCPSALSSKKTTHIYFECDMSAGYGHPVADELMGTVHCVAIFHWKTNLTCLEALYDNGSSASTTTTTLPPPSNSDSAASTDPRGRPTSSAWTIVSVVLVVFGLVFVAVLVLFKSDRGKRVVASARRIVGARGDATLLLDDVS